MARQEWNANGERTALAWRAFHIDAAAMRLGDLSDQGKAEAGTRDLAVFRNRHALELFEDAR